MLILHNIVSIIKCRAALTNFDLTESARCSQSTAMVFKGRDNFKPTSKRDKQCTACGKSNHSTKDCYSTHKLFCNYCKKAGHIKSVCRTKKTNKTEISSANATYAFTVNASNQCNIATQNKSQGGQLLMVDCGATSHLVNNENNFINFDKSFTPENHYNHDKFSNYAQRQIVLPQDNPYR
ncbi:hypothetical protein EB796_005096 [Bugula neritina]|uniref:CCHC-type domain-containing protein n=1 Tax=Bugula neritina TaxID=10212 RepID=A0A7J7KD69_BUGNE|nr:hypothetical protein EB796_005096 [Bugula neritina]